MDQDALLGLIDTIYDAGMAPDGWPWVLGQIAEAVGAREAAIGWLAPGGAPLVIAPRTDPDFLASYATHYYALNLFGRHIMGQPVGSVVSDAMLLPREELHRSPFFNEWSAPQGYRTVMGATLAVVDDMRIELQMPGNVEFDADDLRVATILAPHISRAARLTSTLSSARGGVLEAMEQLGHASLALDLDGRVMHASATAQRYLSEADAISVRNGVLVAASPGLDGKLQRLLGACLVPGPSPGAMLQVDRPGRTPLQITAVPLSPSMNAWLPIARILLVVTDPYWRENRRNQRFQHAYELTRAELALTVEIARGDGRAAAAHRRGISDATARSQLTSIFDKTGVRRQAELIRLLHDMGN